MAHDLLETSGDATWTSPAWSTPIDVQVFGGGGDGGGSDNVTPGGGGGAGGRGDLNAYVVSVSTGYSYHVSDQAAPRTANWFIDNATCVGYVGDDGTTPTHGNGGGYIGDTGSNGADGADGGVSDGGDGGGGALGGTLGNNGQSASGPQRSGGGGAGLGVGTLGGQGGYGYIIIYYLPNAPANLAGAVISNTQVNLTWNAIANPNDYEYRYDTTDPPAGSAVSTGTTASASVTGLTAGTTYYFQVRVRDVEQACGAIHGPWSASIAKTTTTTGGSCQSVQLPNNRVGPPALRRTWRSPSYPFDSTVSSGSNRRRRVIISGA